MTSISGLICFDTLAEADDFFKMMGPLLIFGFYIIGSLAKVWAKGRQQDSEKKEPSELTKAVQRRSRQIHQRQVGTQPQAPTQQTGQPQIPRVVHTEQPVEPPAPVRQPPQTIYPAFEVQPERRPRPVQRPKHLRQNRRPKPLKVSKQVQRPKAAEISKIRPIKQKEPGYSLASLMRHPRNLRTGIILKEILDKPLALRDF